MSALVERALRDAGLSNVWDARRAGRVTDEHVTVLRSADLLALGALADRVRAADVGDEVRIYTSEPGDAGPGVTVLPAPDSSLTGLELLREVAIARIAGGRPRVRVDWGMCGLELAQVALGFGANELVGRLASKRGLPLADDERLGVGKKSRAELATLVKRRELEGFVRRAGRVPSFVDEVS